MDNLDKKKAELDKKLDNTDLSKAVGTLIHDAKRRRVQIILLAASVAFDILLSLALAYGWKINHELAIKAESNKQAIIARCEATNEGRARNAKLWDYILDISKNVPRTPEQQKQRDDFIKFKEDTFAPSDCNKIVK